jgi:hypothetical protein
LGEQKGESWVESLDRHLAWKLEERMECLQADWRVVRKVDQMAEWLEKRWVEKKVVLMAVLMAV